MTELRELHDRLDAAKRAGRAVTLIVMADTTWTRMRAQFSDITGVASPTFADVFALPVRLDPAVHHPRLVFNDGDVDIGV